ncbi:MAG TPA: hypothetical protein VEY92_06645 [Pseudoxanthomonas sp.]|nr:hypothetical protein [Pseudoxanthomonas sp.]
MSTPRALSFDSDVQAKLRRYMGALIVEATDTSIEGVVECLEPAIVALFATTPEVLHEALEAEINAIGHEYGLGPEVAHLTRRNSSPAN